MSSTSFRPRSTGRHVSDLAFIAYQELARSSPERSKPTLRAFVAGQADRRSSRMIVKADPYSWPHDAKMEPATTAVIVIDMQVSDAPPPPSLLWQQWLQLRMSCRSISLERGATST